MVSNPCVQIYNFGLGSGVKFSALIPNLVHSATHSSGVTVTLQVTDESLLKYEDPRTDL